MVEFGSIAMKYFGACYQFPLDISHWHLYNASRRGEVMKLHSIWAGLLIQGWAGVSAFAQGTIPPEGVSGETLLGLLKSSIANAEKAEAFIPEVDHISFSFDRIVAGNYCRESIAVQDIFGTVVVTTTAGREFEFDDCHIVLEYRGVGLLSCVNECAVNVDERWSSFVKNLSTTVPINGISWLPKVVVQEDAPRKKSNLEQTLRSEMRQYVLRRFSDADLSVVENAIFLSDLLARPKGDDIQLAVSEYYGYWLSFSDSDKKLLGETKEQQDEAFLKLLQDAATLVVEKRKLSAENAKVGAKLPASKTEGPIKQANPECPPTERYREKTDKP